MKTELVNSTPARWWSLLGLVLVPLLVAGGFLLAGLTSDHRFGQVQAAVVNLDEPVTIDGKYVPLGRQLTANLVDSKRVQNLGWRLDTEENARAGLADGSYAAMVIIPKNFSEAATSYAKNDASTAERATIELTTSPVAGVADATLGKVVALAAADSLNETLTSGYLENIYVGFNDLGKQFSTMADGATDLAKGSDKLVSGIGDAADGSAQLATGARKLCDGLDTMATQTKSMPSDVRKLADGTASYVAGANELAQSTIDSLPQQVALIDGLQQAADGASGLSSGLSTYKSSLLSQASDASDAATQVENVLSAAAADPATYGAAAIAAVHSACGVSTDAAHLATDGAGCVGSLKGAAQALQGAAGGLSQEDPTTHQSLISGASALASSLTTAADQAAAGAPDVTATTKQLKQLIAGGTQLASGTDQLADGMPALAKGISQAADGSSQLADGVGQLSSGLADAKTGGTKFSDGMWKLADGISQGKDKVPSYSSSERTDLASVVAQPVATAGLDGLANTNIGWISLLLIVALWIGALATYAVVKAIGRGLLSSPEPTVLLIGRALLPGILVVGVQALALAGLAQPGLGLSWQKWFEVTGVLLITALAFVMVNHALVAWLGGLGRLISIVFAVVTTAISLGPATDGILSWLRAFSPLTPALDAVRAVVTESGAATTSTLTVVGWLIIGLAASAIAITRRRTTTLADVVASASS